MKGKLNPQKEREEWTKGSYSLEEKLEGIFEETRSLEENLEFASSTARKARDVLIEEWQEYEELPQKWIDTVICCTETLESIRLAIVNGEIGTLKKEQNSFLRSQKNSLNSITKNLELLTQQIKEQRIAPRNQYKQHLEELDNNQRSISAMVYKLQYLIEDVRDVILVAQAKSVSWEFGQVYKKIRGHIKWLWSFIGILIIFASFTLIFAINTMPTSANNILLVSNFTVRIGVLLVIIIPYRLLRRTIISSEEEAKLYKYKETLITTFIAFRERIAEDDKEVRESITRGMLQAIVTPPQGISLPTLSDFLKGTKSLQDDEADASEDTS